MKWVLIDLSWLAYRALHTVGDLEHEDMPTGVIFGFFQQLRNVCMDPKVHSNKVLIFCDSKTSFRSFVYPQYKGQRRSEIPPEEWERISVMHDQRDLLKDILLGMVGFPVYYQEGLESDDLLASAAQRLTQKRERGVIITADGDLYQCITEYVHWYDPQRQLYHDLGSFYEKKGIVAPRWGEVKTLAGCKGDNVAGIPGVAELTAIRFLRGKLPPTYQTHKRIMSEEGRKTISRNYDLVVLPHKKTRRVALREPRYDPGAFFHICKKYGLAMFLREKELWLSFFSGARFKTRKRGEV